MLGEAISQLLATGVDKDYAHLVGKQLALMRKIFRLPPAIKALIRHYVKSNGSA